MRVAIKITRTAEGFKAGDVLNATKSFAARLVGMGVAAYAKPEEVAPPVEDAPKPTNTKKAK